ncbi:MAG: glutamate racemase, partial [Flavobacteriales bacterium]
HVSREFKSGKIGVIGTKGTIDSRVYPKRIKKINPKLSVVSQATPLLAPMIEEGFFNNNISKSVIQSYLQKKNFQNLDAIILGCTHYPLIQKEINAFYQKKVAVIDSAFVVAEKVEEVLSTHALLELENHQPKYKFVVSDYTQSFEKSTRTFFRERIELSEERIWD